MKMSMEKVFLTIGHKALFLFATRLIYCLAFMCLAFSKIIKALGGRKNAERKHFTNNICLKKCLMNDSCQLKWDFVREKEIKVQNVYRCKH